MNSWLVLIVREPISIAVLKQDLYRRERHGYKDDENKAENSLRSLHHFRVKTWRSL